MDRQVRIGKNGKDIGKFIDKDVGGGLGEDVEKMQIGDR